MQRFQKIIYIKFDNIGIFHSVRLNNANLFKNVIDKFQKSGIELSDILIISILFASSVILGSVSLYLFKYIGSRSMFKIRSNIWENILKLDLPTIQKYESGEIISRLKNDIEELNLF